MRFRSGKFIPLMLTTTMLITSLLTGCQTTSSSAALSTGTTTAAKVALVDPGYSDRDLAGTWDAEAATKISLNGSSMAVSGSGATASGGTLTITAAGVYVLSGTLTHGQIVVDAADSDKVQLVLDGVSITCPDSAPVYVKQADKVFLTLAGGSKNTVTDGAAYTIPDGEDEPNAAIFSKSDLTINGAGALTVTANYNNGIASKDDLVITDGTITVTAVNDGLRGRDSVAIHDGAFVINAAQGDGIQSNNDEDTEKGWVSIDGGTFDITSGNDGIQAETVLQITDGEVTTKTGGGSANASTDSKGNERPGRGGWDNQTAPAAAEDSADSSDSTASAKGVKAGTAVYVTGGNINIDSSDDSVHSSGDVIISAGTVTLASGDDGIHADSSLVVDGGAIDISQSYEGLEGTNITVNGGNIHITAKDDGINAAGGNDGSAPGGRPGENNDTVENGSDGDSTFIRITGGYVVVNANGDGIDANGSLYVDGGMVLVNGPTNNGNGSLDYDGVAEITGGTIVAAGSSGMAQNFSDSSSQNSLLVAYSSGQKAGTLVTLLDESGKTILSFAPAKDYQSIVISTLKLEQGKTYTLYSGGNAGGKNTDGLYTDGSYSAGTEVVSVTLSGAATSISDTGAQITTMGGPGRGGPKGGPMPAHNQGIGGS
ncbi:protein of unknown function [Desulfotomaculum arcticum]|uniref:Carbohydrate-binding domain-containing protein n=1 Tax=Desulfotruncus arcticus DSM 17038 TaxID=1121424 RepID=A0A1I2WDK5_9FIRM|nr:carbohydrate-binding domain-containing protein [Desulfotruncus arcticus]SFG97651.1 protein of unknown function [Desulfotomaculum arcticum] [Desulfotruncus arcticus DSM 17038]